MKFLTLAILVLTSFGINAQIKPKTITNPDGSKSLGWEIGKPKTTITAQGSFSYPNGVVPEPISSKSGANKKNYILVVNESDAKSAKLRLAFSLVISHYQKPPSWYNFLLTDLRPNC
jgi:hypothetical protein